MWQGIKKDITQIKNDSDQFQSNMNSNLESNLYHYLTFLAIFHGNKKLYQIETLNIFV